MLIWITGISGAGKSTVASKLYDKMKPGYPNLVYLDGDEFRKALGDDLGHTLLDRDKNAVRMTGLCKLLCSQGIHVICGANLTSQRFRDWCKREIPDYYEIFLDVPIEILAERDIKGLYQDALAGRKKNVVGVDIPFARPENPYLTIDNSKDLNNFDKILDCIIKQIGIKI